MSRLHALLLGSALALALPTTAAAKKPTAAAKKNDKSKKPEDKRPGDQQASTKKLEETLKKSEEPEEPTTLAPAKLDSVPGTAVTKDEKADKARDEAIDQIKKILPKQKNPDVRADLTFQLAELWWEKSRFVKLAEEMPAYQKAADEWVKCRQQKGEKGCGAEPRPNNRKSELYRKNAVELYQSITKDYPNYARLDEIFFILAYNKYDYAQGVDSKKEKDKATNEALESYRQLIARYPKSQFVSSAFVQLGNYYFDNNQLAPARKAFEEALKLKDPKTETFALYKLAWCDINSGDWDSSFKRFKEVIVRGNKADKKDDDKIKLKSEAMRDIVRVFGERGDFDTAIKFFQDYAGNQGSWRYINMLANYNFNAGGEKQETSIKFFRYMMKERPMDCNAPEWQSKVVLSYDKLSKRQNVLDEMRVLVNNYKPGSDWSNTNKAQNGGSCIRIAYNLTEEALYNLVTDYHQEAIKTKSVATYKLARDIYREYVDNFPDSERAYQMRYYYAEILYALEDYQTAYEQYLKVATDKDHQDGEYKKVAATNMLLSAEKLVDIEAGRYHKQIDVNATADSGKKIDESAAKGDVAKAEIKVKIDKNSPPQKLTDLEQQMVAACDKYTELVPNADDEAKVRLRAAVIYFDRIQYVEAAKRFGYIINKWPEDKTSASAASLILESLEVKEEWAALNKLSREFNGNKKLLEGKDKEEFKKKLPVYIEGSQFKMASEVNDKDKDYPKAAKMFRDFVEEFPKSKFAPIGLAKAFYIYQDAKQLDTAIEMGEKMFKEYADCDKGDWLNLPSGDKRDKKILPDLLFALAKVYEQTADFAIAAVKYEKYVADYAKDTDPKVAERAYDAQFNAAHWYEGLGETQKALKSYDAYIKMYQDLHKKPSGAEDIKRLNLPADSAVAYQEALILEDAKDWKGEYDKLSDYLKNYKNVFDAEKWREVAAMYKQYLAAKQMAKPPRDPMGICTEIVAKYKGAGFSDADKKKESSKLAIAHCRFLQIEPTFTEYSKTVFRAPNTFKADFEKKKKLSAELKSSYEEIVNYANGDYAIAALVRMAMLPKLFGKSLLEAPEPKGLDDEQRELYRATLESKAAEFEEPAIDALELALNKAFELQIYNEWTLQAEDIMKEFKPDAYEDVKEFPLKGSEYFFTAGKIEADGSGGDAK